MAKKKDTYDISKIQDLDARQHLMKRMSLTFGRETGDDDNPFSSQKTVSIRELTDNAIDEVIGGYADHVRVHYYSDNSIEVQDNGRGLPVDIGKDSQGNDVSGLFLTLGKIQSGGKFSTDSKRFSTGQNGIGSSSTNALSKRFDITVYRNNKIYRLSFKEFVPGFFADDVNGPKAKFKPAKKLSDMIIEKDTRPADEKKKFKTGTVVRAWLDDSVFGSQYPINTLDITDRLRGTAFLIPEVTINVVDEVNLITDETTGVTSPRLDEFHFEGGLSELVENNVKSNQIGPVFVFDTEAKYIERNAAVLKDGVVTHEDINRIAPIHVAFTWQNSFDYTMESYVDTIRTRLGGVHEKAFENALLSAFGDRLNSIQGLMKRGDPELKIEDFTEGLVAVVYAQISEPQFTGQTKEELGGRAIQHALQNALTEEFAKFVQQPKNTDAMKAIGAKIITAAKTRATAQAQKDLKRKKAAIENSGDMPAKLLDCEITHNDNSELYIVEGDSALSSLKGARNSKYQALLPIRGKIISAAKATPAKVLANVEVQEIIKCLGAGSGSTFDLNKTRYGRVFIAADADPDGGDIAALITVLFWHLFRPMVEDGRLYRIQTPLFVITTKEGKNSRTLYAENDREHDDIVAELNSKNIKFVSQRLKGLGEGGADVMSDTGMNPLTRTVKQIVVRDLAAAEEMMGITLGPDADKRKTWIQENPVDEMENLE